MSGNNINRRHIFILIGFLMFFGPAILFWYLHPITFNKKAPNDYSAIFDTIVGKHIKLVSAFNFKDRNPIIIYEYKNHYTLFVYKVHLSQNHSLKDIIHVNRLQQTKVLYNRDEIHSDKYAQIPMANYKFEYSVSHPEIKDNLFLTFDCDSLNTKIFNDTLADYFLSLNSISIKYNINGESDIQINKNTGELMPQFEVTFLKKGLDIYMLFTSPFNHDYFRWYDSNTDMLKL